MAEKTPNNLSKDDLKSFVRSIILNQGNKYIKELLRKNDIKIGVTKEDFSQNLMVAIEEDKLSQEIIEEWLNEVEGWGNQHIYLYSPPNVQVNEIEKKIQSSPYAELLGKQISYEFPDELQLTTLTLSPELLSMEWHISNIKWNRSKDKDFQNDEDGDIFEYRAFRKNYDRKIVRFEWQLKKSYCTILIQLPKSDTLHSDAIEGIMNDLTKIELIPEPLQKISLGEAFKTMSKHNNLTVQSSRMRTDGGHVRLVSTLKEGGITDIEALRHVQKKVDLKKFATADGVFIFSTKEHKKLSRAVKVEGCGIESRIRIWVQCNRDDITHLINIIYSSNQPQ